MSATKVIPPNRDAERIIRCAATLMRAAHTVEELTADQRDGWLTIGADARDSCDALRAEVAAQRELLEDVTDAVSPGAAAAWTESAVTAMNANLTHTTVSVARIVPLLDAIDACREHLAGAAVPGTEGRSRLRAKADAFDAIAKLTAEFGGKDFAHVAADIGEIIQRAEES
jgi:hypothetical protein